MISTTIHKRALTLHTWDPEPLGQISADPDQETSAPGKGGMCHLIHVPIPSMLGTYRVWQSHDYHWHHMDRWIYEHLGECGYIQLVHMTVTWPLLKSCDGQMLTTKVAWIDQKQTLAKCVHVQLFQPTMQLGLVSRVDEKSTLRQVCKFPWQ